MQPLHSLTPPMLDPGGWSHLFLNWSGTTAWQLSLTGLHYFRVTKHWEMVITGSACPRPRGAAGLSHTTLCLRKEPQPERSTSQHGKETPQLLPCSESPTPPSAHVWPCCYGHCTQPPPLADHPHCGYKSEHLFLKNTKAITSWCSNTYSTIIYIICTTYINIPYCTMWLQGATNDEKAQEGFKCQRHLLLGLDWVFILEMKGLVKITKR